jgi:DNA-binding MarR family transcriptional regulator
MERRDRTQIQLAILYQLVVAGGKLPLHTRDGLRYRLGLHERTLKRAVDGLERLGLVERCAKPTQRGEVDAVQLSEEASQQLARAILAIGVLT